MITHNYVKSGKFGGTKEVFYIAGTNRLMGVEQGGRLDPAQAPAVGEAVFAGDFGYFNEATGKVKLLKTFKLHTALTLLSEEVIFVQDEFSHVLHEGDFVMVSPATPTTVGTAVTVGTITDAVIDGVPVKKFAITAEDLGAVDAGTVFVIAAASGAEKLPAVPVVNVVFAETCPINVPLRTSSSLQDGHGDVDTNLWYHAVLMRESILVPTYVESLSKINNSTRLFEL